LHLEIAKLISPGPNETTHVIVGETKPKKPLGLSEVEGAAISNDRLKGLGPTAITLILDLDLTYSDYGFTL
jgi:hypothetical protein